MSENQNKVPLSVFFAAVERRLAKKFPAPWPSFQVEVAGRIIELRFASSSDAEYASMGLRGRIVQTERNPHTIFKYWQDSCAEYIGEDNNFVRWKYDVKDGFVANFINEGILCADFRNKVFYCCNDIASGNRMLYMHAMHRVFYQWAFREGMIMFHSAAIGVNGVGALIAGQSGAGKSTLSTACMLAGMDVVGDDYIILTGTGEHRAMPLYSTVCLNKDMCEKLKPDMQTIETAPSGKCALDASVALLQSGLKIKCLLIPVRQKDGVLRIASVPSGPVITRIVYSTMIQAGFSRETQQVHQMATRLSDLPAYEFHQCGDPRRNAEFLREFIIKEM